MIDYLNMLPGVSIVTCAGNEGNAYHHYLITQEYEEISINVEKSSLGFVAELWWRTPGTLQFDVVSPGGVRLELPGRRLMSGKDIGLSWKIPRWR